MIFCKTPFLKPVIQPALHYRFLFLSPFTFLQINFLEDLYCTKVKIFISKNGPFLKYSTLFIDNQLFEKLVEDLIYFP
jgi:hypothetical protein